MGSLRKFPKFRNHTLSFDRVFISPTCREQRIAVTRRACRHQLAPAINVQVVAALCLRKPYPSDKTKAASHPTIIQLMDDLLSLLAVQDCRARLCQPTLHLSPHLPLRPFLPTRAQTGPAGKMHLGYFRMVHVPKRVTTTEPLRAAAEPVL